MREAVTLTDLEDLCHAGSATNLGRQREMEIPRKVEQNWPRQGSPN